MPLESLHTTSNSAWALWKIDEEENALAAQIVPFDIPPPNVTHPNKRLEYFAGRILLRELVQHWDLDFRGITKDENGKPYLKGYTFPISLSHSYPYVAAVIHRTKPVGIDLEQPKEKLLRIAARVLHAEELKDAGNDIVKHCIYWCAKESLIKVHGKKDLTLAQDLKIHPFSRTQQGNLVGEIIVNEVIQTLPLQYFVYENFVVVITNE
jgi:phosphopantetheinyl transferase